MKTDNSTFLAEEPLFPLLVKMSTPAIIGMLVMALYNVVDTIFVGRGAGSLAIAGLAIVFPIQMIVGALGQMVGVGAASIVSRRLGEKNMGDAEAALGTSLLFIAIVGLVLAVMLVGFTEPVLRMFGATDAILPFATDYVIFLLLSLPVHAVTLAGTNLIRAEGAAKTAMNVMLVGIILNIILDPIFIFWLDMGIKGAAIATAIAQFVGFIWMALFYIRGNSVVSLRVKHLVLRGDILREILILGLPNFVQMAGVSIISTLFNNLLGIYAGDIGISAYGVIFRLFSFVIMPINGLAQGFQPIAGFNYGAGKFDRVRKVFYLALVSSTAVAGFFYFFLMLFPDVFIKWFTTDMALVEYTVPALRTMIIMTPLVGIQVVSSIYFQAVGKGIPALLLGLSRQFLVLLPVVLIFSRLFGAAGIWYSFPASDVISTVITVTALFFEIRHLGTLHRNSLVENINPDGEHIESTVVGSAAS